MRVLRAFGFGFAGVLLAVHLQDRGFAPPEVGIFLSLGLLAASVSGIVAAAAARRLGSRSTLAALGLLMALSGIDLSFAHQHWLLFMAALTGMAGVAGVDLGPFLPVEQSVLTQTTSARGRNRAFGRYSFAGAIAGSLGAFTAALANSGTKMQLFFALFALLGIFTATVPLLLAANVETQPLAQQRTSLRPVIGLSALFSIDSLGGGLVVDSVVVYWLHLRFGAMPAVLGPSVGAMAILAAFSFEVAGRLADRIGLVNTMVFTHLPSNLLLLAVPFMPGLGWAIGILMVRAAVESMDQPTRQAYVVSIVQPHERSEALAVTGAVRGVAASAGPVLTGAAIQSAASGTPFIAAGVLKACYDIALFVGYRRRLGDHEPDLIHS